MSWTDKQKMIAASACRKIGLHEEDRMTILRQFPHAMHEGRITSTSPRLSNADFERFMAYLEHWNKGGVPGWPARYWEGKADDGLARMREKAQRIALRLEAAGALHPCGEGLRGWILHQTGEACQRLTELDYRDLYNLIEALKQYAHRRGVKLAA